MIWVDMSYPNSYSKYISIRLPTVVPPLCYRFGTAVGTHRITASKNRWIGLRFEILRIRRFDRSMNCRDDRPGIKYGARTLQCTEPNVDIRTIGYCSCRESQQTTGVSGVVLPRSVGLDHARSGYRYVSTTVIHPSGDGLVAVPRGGTIIRGRAVSVRGRASALPSVFGSNSMSLSETGSVRRSDTGNGAVSVVWSRFSRRRGTPRSRLHRR